MKKDTRTEAYIKKLKGVRLSDAARARIRENLDTYITFYEVPQKEGVRGTALGRFSGGVLTRTRMNYRLFGIKVTNMTAAILATLLLFGGTSYAAQGSVPGDILYPVKVNINEKAETALAFSNDAKAHVETQLVEERLKEAETLAARGELDATTSAELRNNIAEHYNAANAHSKKAEESGNLKISANTHASLEGVFRSYADILSGLDTNARASSSEHLVSDLRAYADGEARAQATTTVGAFAGIKANIQAVLDRADSRVDNAKSRLADAQTKLSSSVYTNLHARMNNALTAQTRAHRAFESGRYQEAYVHAETAIRTAQEVETLVDSSLRLKSKSFVGSEAEVSRVHSEQHASTSRGEDEHSQHALDAGGTTTVNINADGGHEDEHQDEHQGSSLRGSSDTGVSVGESTDTPKGSTDANVGIGVNATTSIQLRGDDEHEREHSSFESELDDDTRVNF